MDDARRDGLEVRIIPTGSSTTVRIEVDYDGAAPPDELFADLAMVGWHVPAAIPPPRDAIDWSTPDPETGQRFSVRSWPVIAFGIIPPKGSGPRGAWSAAESRPLLDTLRGVLRRHGVTVLDPHAPTAVATPSAPTPPRTATPVATTPTMTAAGSTGSATVEPGNPAHLADDPPISRRRRSRERGRSSSRMVSAASLGVPDELDPIRLVADVADEATRISLDITLTAIGVTTGIATVERTVRQSYRAATYDRVLSRAIIAMTFPRTNLAAVMAVLHEVGAEALYDPVIFAAVEQALEAARPEPPALAAVPDDATRDDQLATIRLIVDPAQRAPLEKELASLPIATVAWSDTERSTIGTYRGVSYERSTAALQVDISLGRDVAGLVGGIAAAAANISIDDDSRYLMWIPEDSETPADEEPTSRPGLRTA